MSHNTNKRIAQNTLFLYFRTLVILLASLYTSRVVLNVLGIDDYGIYNVVGGIVLMFQFLNVGMIDVSQRFLTYELGKNDGQQLQKVFSTSLIIHLIIIFFLLILAETVGLWFLNHKMNIPTSRIIAANWVFQFSILTFIIKIFSVPYNASIVAHEHMKVYAYVSILEVILQLAIVFLLKGSASDKLILYAILMSFVTLLISIMYTLYCKKYFKECKFRNDTDKQLLHKMLSFAGWSFLGNIGYSLKMQGINILINLFFGPAVNAARGVAYQVNAGIYNFVSNFQIAMKPQITKRYAMGDTNSMMVLVHNSSRYSFFLLLYLTLPVLIKTPYILNLWQGKIKLFQTIILVITLLDIPISYIVLKSGYPPYTVMYISILTELIALIARIWILNALIPMHISNFIIEVIGRSLLVFILAAIIPTGLSQYIPDTFTGFILICIITVSSTTIVLLTVGLKTAERSLIYKKAIRTIQTTKS